MPAHRGGTPPDWGRLSSGQGVHLDAAERQQRQQAAAIRTIRQMIKGNRQLFGEKISDVAGLFRAIDADGGGTIERGEFGAALARLGLGLSTAQLSELWSGLDADGNGVIDYDELLAELAPPRRRPAGAAGAEPQQLRKRPEPLGSPTVAPPPPMLSADNVSTTGSSVSLGPRIPADMRRAPSGWKVPNCQPRAAMQGPTAHEPEPPAQLSGAAAASEALLEVSAAGGQVRPVTQGSRENHQHGRRSYGRSWRQSRPCWPLRIKVS